MLTTKEIERLAVEKYLQASDQSYEVEDFESPDFILRGKGKKIGCEVTEFYPDYSPKGSDLRQRERYLNNFHQKLKTKLLEYYPQGYTIGINYKPYMSEKSSTDLEVESVFFNIKQSINLRYINDPSKNIRGILIHKIGDFPTLISQMIASDDITPKAEWLIPMIESKTKLMQNWNSTFSEKWLIISIGPSRAGYISINRIKNLDSVKYILWNKIILIDIHFADYIEIKSTEHRL
jgi:hypothetical protein